MNIGQEFTHTVTTTVTDTNQSILNSTQLTENGAIVINSSHEVNIPLGAKYNIEVTGDINAASISRNLNVLNNLLGDNVFTFKDGNEATDTDVVKFTAAYDAPSMELSGNAAINSLVRIVFEDGSSQTTLANSLGAWTFTIKPDDLDYGINNVVLLNGTQADQIKVINITVNEPVIVFNPGFTDQINRAGTAIAGTVEDSRAVIKLRFGQVTQTVLPKPDKTWEYQPISPLAHGTIFDVYVEYGEESSEIHPHIFYKLTASLDEVKGQYISGFCAPGANVQVITTKYNVIVAVPSVTGGWFVSFPEGLPANELVTVNVNGDVIASLTYTGEPNLTYPLTVNALNATTLKGTGRPGDELMITFVSAASASAIVDSDGNWTSSLSMPMTSGEQITVVAGNGQSISTFYIFVAPIPFTAYISNDGLTLSGTSAEPQVSIELPNLPAELFTVTDGNWSLTLDTPLLANDLIKITSGTAMKTLQFIGIESFTAALNELKDTITGSTDAASNATIRVIFDDNSIVEKAVTGGSYELQLDRVLVFGQVIVVSCINEHGVQTSKSINVE